MVPGLVSFVVQVVVFFLQVELDPVVKTNDFCSRFCLANKDMLKSTGVQAGECFSLEITHKIKILIGNNYINFYTTVVNLLIALCAHTDLMMNSTNKHDHLLVSGRMFRRLTRCFSVCGRGGTRSSAADP